VQGAPGFLAERSVYRSPGRYGGVYRGELGGGHAEGVRAALLDPNCVAACAGNCAQECFELVGVAKGACLRACQREAEICRQGCPDVGPGTGGGGGTPTPTSCAPGSPCFSPTTGQSCDCPPGQVCRQRCGPPICEFDPLKCLFFPPFGCLPQCSPGICSTDSFCTAA
jgi:hypothetical protein